LQVDDQLAAIGEAQGDHAADPLVVDVGRRGVVEAVAGALDGSQGRFRTIHVLEVGHYNFAMLNVRQILISAAGLFAIGVGLAGCGSRARCTCPPVPEAANRATLPSLILPSTRSEAAPAAPADAAATPPAAASSAPASTGGANSMTALRLPGHPHVATRDGAPSGSAVARRAGARTRHAALRLLQAMDARRTGSLPAWLRRPGRADLLCDEGQLLARRAARLREAGCGFDIVSGGELARVLAAGADPAKVIFSGVGKTRDEMRQALAAGIACFNVESEAELDVLNAVALAQKQRARISIRINPNVDPKTHPYISTGLKGNKFGVAHDRALHAYQHAASLPGIEVVGIDCHIGSQITEASPYLDALERVLDLVETIEQAGIPLHHLDFGGGLGIDYNHDTPRPPTCSGSSCSCAWTRAASAIAN
jgi:hypothetical protein